MKKLLVALAVSALLPTSAFAWERAMKPASHMNASEYRKVTNVEVFGMKSNIDGNVRVDGLVLDLDSEASFDSENRMGIKVDHVLSKKGRLSFSYLKHDHTGRINKTVTFKKRNYQANASAQIETDWFDISYSHLLAVGNHSDPEKKDAFYLDGIFGLKFSESKINVTGYETGTSAYVNQSWSESFPVPYLGLGAGGQLAKNLWLKGQIKYMNVNAAGNDVMHYDFGINAALRINPNATNTEWFVDLGYRKIKFDADTDSNNAELSYSGPTLGLVARF